MAIWQNPTKAEKKRWIEEQVEIAINEIETSGKRPTDWQIICEIDLGSERHAFLRTRFASAG